MRNTLPERGGGRLETLTPYGSLPFKGRVRVGMGLNRYLVTNLNTNIAHYISLSMGEGIVTESPDVIISPGLGSCVALMLYDNKNKVGGMAHVMLPDSKAVVSRPTEDPPMPPLEKRGGLPLQRNFPPHEQRGGLPLHGNYPLQRNFPPLTKGGVGGVILELSENSRFTPYWFADTAINYLLSAIFKKGTAIRNITAKAVGGACMFPVYEGEIKGIGEQNIESIKVLLRAMNIPIVGWDLGGNYGRSAEFFLETGRVLIKTFGREDKEI